MTLKKVAYLEADVAAVLDNPEWTDQTTKRSRSFDAAFPDLARRVRGAQKAPTKTQVTLRLDQRVLDHFKSSGGGWQSRINEALLKAAGFSNDEAPLNRHRRP